MILKVLIVLGVVSAAFADGHYAYSEQKIVKHDVSHHGHHGELSHIGSHKPEHHEEYAWAYPAYEFSYKVEDPHTNDYKGQHEIRDGDKVKGMYWLIQPDGKKRTVTYHADKHSGFNAHVEYSEPIYHVHEEKQHETHHDKAESHEDHHETHLGEIHEGEQHDNNDEIHHDEHHKEEHHENNYSSKPYGYQFAIYHYKPYVHHVENHQAGEVHGEEENTDHYDKHHNPKSEYYLHIKHPKYNQHEEQHHEHHDEEAHHHHGVKSHVEHDQHHKEETGIEDHDKHEGEHHVDNSEKEHYKHHEDEHHNEHKKHYNEHYSHHLENYHNDEAYHGHHKAHHNDYHDSNYKHHGRHHKNHYQNHHDLAYYARLAFQQKEIQDQKKEHHDYHQHGKHH